MAAKKKSTAKKSTSKAQAKVGKVMHEFKHGELKSGGRAKVKNPKQAIAIGLSEARKAGAKIPAKGKSAAKKGATKKTAAKKSPAKKSGAKKGAAKKSSSKKS
jgi:hypothetical protein